MNEKRFPSGPATRRRLAAAALLALAALPAAAQSLYDEKTFRPLTADSKAFRPGDIITIQVIENASASANADTGLRRSNTGGAELRFRSPVPVAAATAEANTGFDGGGQTQRAGRLLAQLSVTVRDVAPNGDLMVFGEQQLVINEEQQRINVEGRVRPQDISDANVVLSTRLADARITYVGEGDVGSRQKPGWWRHFLDLFGL